MFAVCAAQFMLLNGTLSLSLSLSLSFFQKKKKKKKQVLYVKASIIVLRKPERKWFASCTPQQTLMGKEQMMKPYERQRGAWEATLTLCLRNFKVALFSLEFAMPRYAQSPPSFVSQGYKPRFETVCKLNCPAAY